MSDDTRVDPYVSRNIAALAAIDWSPDFHGVDGRTVSALLRRGLVYQANAGSVRLTQAGSKTLASLYVTS